MFRSNVCGKTWTGTLSQLMSDEDLSVTGEICFSSDEKIKELVGWLSDGETDVFFTRSDPSDPGYHKLSAGNVALVRP